MITPHVARGIEIRVERRRPLGKWARRVGGTLGVAGGGFLSGALALAYYVARRITAPTTPTPFDAFTFTPFEFGVPYESVAFPTGGGATLRGWLLPRPESRRVVIACGGYRGRRADLLGISTALWRDGANVLIFAGTPVTLGYQELQDVLAAVDFVEERIPGASIGLLGYSMGASIAIMAAARRPDIAAVVADSPFARQRDAVSLRMRQVLRVPHGPLLALVDLLLGRLSGYHFRDVEPLREVGLLSPRPLLLIHGDADTVTDPRDSASLYTAAGEPKELWIAPGVEHCGTYFADRAAYSGRVAAFFRRALIAQDAAPAGAAQPAR